ncbi:MAG: PAS domain S-box protein [Candidatus Nitrotoga sp.]
MNQTLIEAHYAVIPESSTDAIVSKTLDGLVSSWNSSAERMFGYTAQEMIGKPLALLIPPGHEEEEARILDKICNGERIEHFETMRKKKNGELVPVSVTISPIRYDPRSITGASKISRGITGQKKLEVLQGQLSAITESSTDAIVSRTLDGIVTSWNLSAERVFGYTAQEMIGKPIALLVPPGHEGEEAQILAKIRNGECIEHFETIRKRKNGELVPVSVRISPIRYAAESITGASKISRDITDPKKLDALQGQFAAIIESSTDAIVSKTLDGIVTIWNSSAETMFGYTAQEMIGKPMALLIPPGHEVEEAQILAKIRNGERIEHFETIRKKKNGELFPISVTISPIRDDTGSIIGTSNIARDITERKLKEMESYQLAFYDVLTGLPNRRLLNDRLEQTKASSKRTGHYAALIFLDLDNFKPLNDTYGHDAGDLLLREVAHRISSCVRAVDTVARFGGDEFVVILRELDVDKFESARLAGIIAEKIRFSLAEPYVLKIQFAGKVETPVEHHCTSSIGVELFNSHKGSVVDIIKRADIAMYQAKGAGRNQIRFYEELS